MNIEYFKFMKNALELAKEALACDQWPVGAVVVCDGKIIASARNMMEELNDPTAHAEILAAKKATAYLQTKCLNNCDLYVTLQPCLMCFHTLKAYRIRRIIYGAENGFVQQPDPILIGGVYEEESSQILKMYAKKMR